MRRGGTKRLWIMAMLIAGVSFPVAAGAAPQGALSPETLKGIRVVGQNVLNAKHKVAPSTEAETLKQSIEELRTAVEARLAVSPDSVLVGPGELSKKGGVDKRDQSQKAKKDADDALKGKLTQLRQKRAALEKRLEKKSAAAQAASLERNAATKVSQLEAEFQEALDSPDEAVKTAKLQKLRDRLAKNKPIIVESQAEKTPTIQTIVRHRNQ